jgi:transposase
MSKRRKFTAEFKAKVALEALAGELTLAQLSSKYGGMTNQPSSTLERPPGCPINRTHR